MSNSATSLNKIPINVKGSDIDGVTPVKVIIDTGSADLTVYTPSAGKRWAIVGWMEAEATAANLTVKSGTTTLFIWEGAANRRIEHPVGNGILFVGNVAGEALVLNSSATNPSYVMVYVAEFSQIRISF